MNLNPILLQGCAFAAVTAAVGLALMLLRRQDVQLKERLEALSGPGNAAFNMRRRAKKQETSLTQRLKHALVRFGGWLLPDSKDDRSRVQTRLIQAGIYSQSAPSVFVTITVILLITPIVIGLLAGSFGWVSLKVGLVLGAGVGGCGILVPGFWLDWKKSKRQGILRRSLPDFLDLIVACIESGMSLEGAMQRVSDELRTAHPLLAAEMGVVQREIEFGRTTDVALRNFAERSELDAVKTLSTFVQQARRFGSSMADSLRVHADMLREQREQRVEELAQKAAVKILFPTLLFIFPAIFVVLVGPAAVQIQENFAEEKPAATSNVNK